TSSSRSLSGSASPATTTGAVSFDEGEAARTSPGWKAARGRPRYSTGMPGASAAPRRRPATSWSRRAVRGAPSSASARTQASGRWWPVFGDLGAGRALGRRDRGDGDGSSAGLGLGGGQDARLAGGRVARAGPAQRFAFLSSGVLVLAGRGHRGAGPARRGARRRRAARCRAGLL